MSCMFLALGTVIKGGIIIFAPSRLLSKADTEHGGFLLQSNTVDLN